MSEGKWNHPMFEQIRNAEVEAPEHIMHAAIKKSNRNGFFYFQWQSFNVWYLALGLSSLLVLLFANVNNGQSAQFRTEVKETSTIGKPATSPIDQKMKVNQEIKLNNPTVIAPKKKTTIASKSSNAHERTEASNEETSAQRNVQEPLNTLSDTEVNTNASVATSQELQQELNKAEPLTTKRELPKKGRSLRVKIGDNAKP
jgi:cytoskeletal protein RodZ